MAHLTLVGALWIPNEYPNEPPGVQLYTRTLRPNVDVFRSNFGTRNSSLCFDILRSAAKSGTWKPDCSLSCLLASLMSAIVSFYVAQDNGRDRAEYVSMEKLRQVKEGAGHTFKQYESVIPPVPRIPLIEAAAAPAMAIKFELPEIQAGHPELVTSEPIYLQTGSDELHAFAVDLSGLHDHIVFSVILSNSRTDLVGKRDDTVLVRNGVTATAARKRARAPTMWFYHGKPMNEGDMRLHVTIGRDQMTFAYEAGGRQYIHGDCPVSLLTPEQIGDVQDIPFYVHIYTIDKTMKGAKLGKAVKIPLMDIQGQGYYHDPEDRRG